VVRHERHQQPRLIVTEQPTIPAALHCRDVKHGATCCTSHQAHDLLDRYQQMTQPYTFATTKPAKKLSDHSCSWSDVNFATWINACLVHSDGTSTTFQVKPESLSTYDADVTSIGQLLSEHVDNIVLRHDDSDIRVMHGFIQCQWDRCSCGCDPQHPSDLPKHDNGSSFRVCTYCRHGKSVSFINITNLINE